MITEELTIPGANVRLPARLLPLARPAAGDDRVTADESGAGVDVTDAEPAGVGLTLTRRIFSRSSSSSDQELMDSGE